MSGLATFFQPNSSSCFATSLLTAPVAATVSGRHKEEAMIPYQEWGINYRRALQEFIQWRLRGSREEPTAEDESEESQLDVADHFLGETQPAFHSGAVHVAQPVTSDCYYLDDLSLQTSHAHLPFYCKHLLWPFHEIKSNLNSPEKHFVDINATHSIHSFIHPPPSIEDGPLFPVYRHVLSMVLLEQPWLSLERHGTSIDTFVARVASQVFTTPRKLPQEYPTRRIRLYFYDAYAYWIHQIISSMTTAKAKANPNIYLSLEDIPQICIFPSLASLTDQSYTHYKRKIKQNISHSELLLAEDYGLLSDFSICIGRTSGVQLPRTRDYLTFDSESIRIRILLQCPVTKNVKEFIIKDKFIDTVIGYDSALNCYFKNSRKTFQENGDGQLQLLFHQCLTGQATTKNHQNNSNYSIAHSSIPPLPHTLPNSIESSTSLLLGDFEQTFLFYSSLMSTSKQTAFLIPNKTMYALVLGFTAPTLNKSGTYHMHITLIDPSIPLMNPTLSNDSTDLTPNERSIPHVSLMFFAAHPKSFPKLSRAGDVLCIRDFKIQKYMEEVQLVGQIRGKPSDTRYSVFRPTGTVLEQVALNPSSFTLSSIKDEWIISSNDETSVDLNIVSNLWKWGYTRMSTKSTIQSTSRYSIGQLDSLSVYSLDLDVMITDILPAPPNTNGPKGYLRVWDGSGISISHPLPVGLEKDLDEEDPPCLAIISIEHIIEHLNRQGALSKDFQPMNLEPPKALCGCVINVAIWETIHWDMIQSLEQNFMSVGKFIRFRNILLATNVEQSGCLLNLCTKSWLTPLPDTTFEIREILNKHAERIANKDPFNPTSGLLPLPLTPWNHVAYINSLHHLNETLPTSSITLTFNVLNHSIRPKVDPSVPDALKSLIIFDKVPKFLFSIRITDMTACLDVLVEDSVARTIFGISATNFMNRNEPLSQYILASQRLSALWDTSICFKGTIVSFLHNSVKCFCLKSIEY